MRRVLVFGGSRGIGAACVRRFCRDGDTVAFTFLNSANDARALENELPVRAIRCDVRSGADVDRAVSEAMCALGGLDVLVNCAGVAHFDLAQDISDIDLDRVIDTDLSGTVRACRAAIPHMIAHQSGRIINIASMWGEIGASCESAYSAAKGGVIAFTKALAKELGPSNITVNCVSPGVIDTDMNKSLSTETMAALAADTPLGRIGTPDEVAAAVAFFASDDAGFITGQILGVNGGLVI